MLEQLLPIDLPAGFVNNGTKYLARRRWYAGNLVRWSGKTLQPVGGWTQRSLSAALNGSPSGATALTAGFSTQGRIMVGAGAALYVVEGTTVTTITPAILSGAALTNVYWQITTFGTVVIITYLPTRSLFFWDSAVGGLATLFTGPLGAANGEATVTTPERFLFAFVDRTVYWPSQEGYTDWTPTAQNTAGDFPLETSGTLVCGRATRGGTLIWTTADLWLATYIGGVLVYAFAKVGDACGPVSVHAPVMIGTTAYWMGHGRFYRCDGYVQTIPCDVEDYVFSNITSSRTYKIWGLANPRFGEVTWFYPSANATECDSYVTFAYEQGHWTFGTLARATGIPAQVNATPPVPVLFGTDGLLYDHETGNARTGATVYAESGPVELGDGDQLMRIQRIVPDDKTLGDVSASLITAMYPDAAETTNGPYTLVNPTSVRLTARQVRLKITEAAASAWRVGVPRLGVLPGGRR